MKDKPLAKVAWKFRRALRNETGATFTHEELVAFAHAGALELATRAENEELLALHPIPAAEASPDPKDRNARDMAYIARLTRKA